MTFALTKCHDGRVRAPATAVAPAGAVARPPRRPGDDPHPPGADGSAAPRPRRRPRLLAPRGRAGPGPGRDPVEAWAGAPVGHVRAVSEPAPVDLRDGLPAPAPTHGPAHRPGPGHPPRQLNHSPGRLRER